MTYLKTNLPAHLLKPKSLKELTTLAIGGIAESYLEIKTVNSMQKALLECRSLKLDYFILGKGSNSLFEDTTYQEAILHNKIDFCEMIAPGVFHVGAGYSFSLLGTQTARQNFGGLEFASGIPASVGGAIFMNAGANGSETSNCLVSVDYIDEMGAFHCLKKEELSFSYRTSPFQKLKGAIVGATFQLFPSKEARQKQLDIIRYRQNTQPYKEKSAGCVFKNPQNHCAGKLIEDSGLKGFCLGDAQVSEKHANFLINRGTATCQDFLNLMEHVKQTVLKQTFIVLESEVRLVPSRRISS